MDWKKEIHLKMSNLHTTTSTKTVRDIVKPYRSIYKKENVDEVLQFCETLLQQKSWSSTIVAYQIAYDVRKNYTSQTFVIFEEWMHRYIHDWWDCDDFCTHAFYHAFLLDTTRYKQLFNWIQSSNFAVRRCAPVLLIVPIRKQQISIDNVLDLCEKLLNDDHYLVEKGVGWLLKEATKHYETDVINFLTKHVTKMTRTAFRYAIEKLDKETRQYLMTL